MAATPTVPPRRARTAFVTLALAVAVAGTTLAACGGEAASERDATTATTATVATATGAAGGEATPAAGTPWERIDAPADCMCSDGSPFAYYLREADPTRVLFFLEGGGACFDAESCAPASGSYTVRLSPESGAMAAAGTGQGLLDVTDERNPLRDFSIVYVPYCTGDVHLGDATTDYGGGVVVQHKGARNVRAAIATTLDRFPDIAELVVAGVSAGSIPSPLAAGLLADGAPDARVTVVADGSGGYPNEPALVSYVGGRWGAFGNVPDWPETAGLTPEQWNFAQLYISSGRRHPDIVFTRHDYAFDRTQIDYAAMAGYDASELDRAMGATEQLIESSGVDVLTFLQPGDDHTLLGRPRFYDDELDGARYVDWLTAVIRREDLDGAPPADVRCTDCATGD